MARLKKPLNTLRTIIKAVILVVAGFVLDRAFTVDHELYDRARAGWSIFKDEKIEKSNITIVRLDDSIVPKYGCQVPFPRDVLAQVLTNVAQANPVAIYLDIFLEDQTTQDDVLSNAIRQVGSNKVYLAQDFVESHNDVQLRQIWGSFANLTPQHHGISAYELDDDGVARSTRIKFAGNGNTFFALPAILAANCAQNEQQKNRILSEETIPLQYSASPEKLFHYLDADQLISGKATAANAAMLSQALNSNSIVIIGPFHVASRDVFNAPESVGEHGRLHGAELLAYSLKDLTAPKIPRYVVSRTVAKWGVGVIAAIIGMFLGRWLKWWPGPLVFFLVPIIYAAVCSWQIDSGIYLPLAPVVIGWIFGWEIGKEWHSEQLEQTEHSRHHPKKASTPV